MRTKEVQHKANIMRGIGWLFIVMLVVTMVLTLLVILRQGQKLDAATTLIAECTTPPASRVPPVDRPRSDDCWVRSQGQTQDVVDDIGTISIAAASCGAAHPGDVDATRRCVEEILAQQNAGGK